MVLGVPILKQFRVTTNVYIINCGIRSLKCFSLLTCLFLENKVSSSKYITALDFLL